MTDGADLDDFYDRLVRLTAREPPEPLLAESLASIVRLTRAELVLLEIYDEEEVPRFTRAHHCSAAALQVIRNSISRRIIGRTLAEGRTITTASALTDDRFADLDSVRQRAIKAVLCAPVGLSSAVGVIYLQGASGAFGDRERQRVETFARAIAGLAERFVRSRVPGPTLAEEMLDLKELRVREALARNGDNLSRAARELGVTRAVVYRAKRQRRH